MSKRAANLIVISSHAEVFPAVHCAPQLASVNRKIAERVTDSSNAHVHAIFAEAARTARYFAATSPRAFLSCGIGRPRV
jgi:hypothetical protein